MQALFSLTNSFNFPPLPPLEQFGKEIGASLEAQQLPASPIPATSAICEAKIATFIIFYQIK